MHYPRVIFNKVYELSQKDQAVILIGTRQVGKTVLMRMLEKRLQDDGKVVFFFDLELPSNLQVFGNGVDGFIQFLQAKGVEVNKDVEDYIFVFIDEFHYIENAGSFIKAICDNFPKIHIVASGSSSVEVQKNLKESSVGRKRIIQVFPLTFREFLTFKEKKEGDVLEKDFSVEKPILEPLHATFSNLFFEFLIWGGMPRSVIERDTEERRAQLDEIVSSYLQKDIKALVGGENVIRFNELMQVLASETATAVNMHSLSNILRMNIRELEKHLYILKHTFVNYFIAPFYTNKRKELSKMTKSYFYDTGVRNFLINNMSSERIRGDIGRLMETAVYNELNKNLKLGQKIYYWRTIHQTEVDIVLERDNKFIPVEVKSSPCKHIPKAIMSFIEAYPCKSAVIVNSTIWSIEKYKNIPVYFIPPYCTFCIPALL